MPADVYERARHLQAVFANAKSKYPPDWDATETQRRAIAAEQAAEAAARRRG